MIIGITGTNGAGKGTVGKYLAGQHGFFYFSAREIWIEEVERRGLPVDRDTIARTANLLRAERGPDYFAQRALERAGTHPNAVFESIRTVGEAEFLKSHGGVLWAVDAEVKERYARVVKRQSQTDHVSYKTFVAQERQEWENQDPTKQNLKAVIEMADYTFTNNGTPEELYVQIEGALKKYDSY